MVIYIYDRKLCSTVIVVVFPKKLRLFKNERIRQKELGNSVKQLALKILINGGYGVFGSKFFKYRDLRVAELITAYGRYTLTKMQEIAEEMGLHVVYGDTDSLFMHHSVYTASQHHSVYKIVSKVARTSRWLRASIVLFA
jgi:DNA polymerase elongation subunit (family B)